MSIVRIVWSWAELASLLASSVGCPYVVVNRPVGCVKSWFYLVSRLPQCWALSQVLFRWSPQRLTSPSSDLHFRWPRFWLKLSSRRLPSCPYPRPELSLPKRSLAYWLLACLFELLIAALRISAWWMCVWVLVLVLDFSWFFELVGNFQLNFLTWLIFQGVLSGVFWPVRTDAP